MTYNLAMETTIAKSVSEILDEAIRRRSVASLPETFRKIDEHVAAQGISAEEIESAIDEAMEHIRPRKP